VKKEPDAFSVFDTNMDKNNNGKSNSTDLTPLQIKAFREAFELFDKNGGGTIDASELQRTLADVDIHIDSAGLLEVMLTLDGDGNGEVDFDEFLKIMTDTEMFIEVFVEKNTGETLRSRRVVLFDALIEFMKKQALRNADEISRYYAKKYRKVASNAANKGAHVVGHYADGVRLIGLTDKQLLNKLKILNKANNEIKDQSERSSPYAKSFDLLRAVLRDKPNNDTLSRVKPYALGGPRKRPVKKSKSKKNELDHGRRTIALRIVGFPTMMKQESKLLPAINESKQMRERRKSVHQSVHDERNSRPLPHVPGWIHHTVDVTDVDIHVKPGWSKVSIDSIRQLKKLVQECIEAYLTRVACKKVTTNLKLYRSLNTRPARTVGLRAQLARCMVAYSSATNDQASKITTKTLEKIFQKDQKMLKMPPISKSKSNSGMERKSMPKPMSSSIFQPKSNILWAD